jgi:hypothetical protein
MDVEVLLVFTIIYVFGISAACSQVETPNVNARSFGYRKDGTFYDNRRISAA